MARLSYLRGTVSFSPAGEDDWVRAVPNRPLTTGDRLWVDAGSRAELQVGGAAIRLGGSTSVTLLNLDDQIVQVQLSEGALKARVRRMGPDQVFEVDTPNLALVLDRPGEFRIDVQPNEDATGVMVLNGRAELYGEGASYEVAAHQGYRFFGTGLGDYDRMMAQRDDDLDAWARYRDQLVDHSQSARYVSSDVVGYEDLDSNGTWRNDPNYGNVWMPTHVAAGWTPYHDGHWAWIDPWGWTWVDDAPWGYAVSHYGRWANIRGSWGWVPGPQREQAVYAPALVAFVGGEKSFVGWFPLAPREVYQPSYPVSRGYFDKVNRSNAVIAPATIANVYNTTKVTSPSATRVVYANQQVKGAVVAMPPQAFAQSQPVAKAAVPVSKEATSAPVAHVAAVAPVQQSVQGGAPAAGAKPRAAERPVVARTAPPPPPVAFAAQRQQLAAKPGQPIDQSQRSQLKPANTPAPKVSVVATSQAPAPKAPPPATPPAPKSPEARKAEAARPPSAKPEAVKPDVARTEAGKGNAAKMDASKADAAKVEAAKAEAAKVDAAKGEAMKADAARAEAAKAAAAKSDAAKADAMKADAARAEAAKAAAAKSDAAKAEAMKADAAKAEAARAEAAKTSAAKSDAAKADAMKADAARAEAARAEAAKAAAAKADAAKADAARAEAARADAAKAAAAKANAARAEAARAQAAQAEAAKAAAAKAEAARAEAAKAAPAKPEAAKGPPAKPDSAKASKEKSEADAKKEQEKKAAEEAKKG
ncbi:MAG: DUF6600 domain-containing protein [Usitatibacter sp.]